MFRRMDIDESGEVTLEELMEAFVQMKQATKGMERVLAFITQTFQQADADGSGSPRQTTSWVELVECLTVFLVVRFVVQGVVGRS